MANNEFSIDPKTYVAQIVGTSPYSQSKHFESDKGSNESDYAYELRSWKRRLHVTSTGYVEIPPMAWKLGLWQAAQHLGMKLVGRRGATFAKRFDSGIYVDKGMVLDIKADDVDGDELFVPNDGKRGGGSRVTKIFSRIFPWGGKVEINVLDGLITQEILLRHLQEMGVFVGIGRFRPERGGYFGRFRVVDVSLV